MDLKSFKKKSLKKKLIKNKSLKKKSLKTEIKNKLFTFFIKNKDVFSEGYF